MTALVLLILLSLWTLLATIMWRLEYLRARHLEQKFDTLNYNYEKLDQHVRKTGPELQRLRDKLS